MKSGLMRAVAVLPGKRELAIVSQPLPEITSASQVKVRTIEVGVCGTDREICNFDYGDPPPGSEFLVLGHEALGEVVEVGSGSSRFKVGDLVVPSIRRPCQHRSCFPCRADRADFCSSGDFSERGIKSTHGFLTEYFVEDEKYLHLASHELREVGVLAEPLTVTEKALTQVWQIQLRVPSAGLPMAGPLGAGKTAVVLGAGPVGILAAMAFLTHGYNTFVYSRSAAPNLKSDLVQAIGAQYVSTETTPVDKFAAELGGADLVYEATGAAGISFESMKLLAWNGIGVLTGIPAQKPPIPISADSLMRDLVLKNQVVLGTVNADRSDFDGALRDLGVFRQRWPDALRALITGRYPMEAFRDLLVGYNAGIKSVITLD